MKLSLNNNNNDNDLLNDLEFIKNNMDKIKATINFIERNESNKNQKKIKCKYGTTCCNDSCNRNHPAGWDAKEARNRLSKITCKYGDKCTAIRCLYNHDKDKKRSKSVSISPLALSPLSSPKSSDLSLTRSSRSLSTSSNCSITSRPQQNYISLNVEYIANGFGHNDRFPCWIIMTDYSGNILYNKKINPNLSRNVFDIVSTLEPITGITMEILESEGISYNEAMISLKDILDKDVVFIGHNVDVDILRLGLEQGIDYKNYIDIVTEFRTIKKYGSSIKNKYFTLNQEKSVLLNINEESSNLLDDAKITMTLFKNWIKPGETKKARAKKKLIESKFITTINKDNFIIDGVCCSPYRKDKCICSFHSIRT
tara:strand:+ start:2709 stop:3815 length:1107 start_codon:yes stop_codon:yes gene_type:complete